MDDLSVDQLAQGATLERDAPTLVGLKGRMRLLVGAEQVGVLLVENGRAKLVPDASPIDVTLICDSRQTLIKALRGELNPVLAALRNEGRFQGNRELGVRISYALREGSPFAEISDRKDQ